MNYADENVEISTFLMYKYLYIPIKYPYILD